MLNSKIIDIFRTFSHAEFKRFGDFVSSPFHNKNRKLIRLFDLLSGFYPSFDSNELTKEYLFDKIFGKEKKEFTDASIRNLLSDLIILAEKYLSYLAFEKDKFDFYEKSLRELCERKLDTVFEKKLKSAEELFTHNETEGEFDYYRKFILEELKSSSKQFYDNLKLYKSDFNLKASDYLTYFFLVKSFKIINFFAYQKQYNIDTSQSIVNKILSDIDLDEFLKRVKQKSSSDHLILSVYCKMYFALINPDDEEFYFEYRKILLENDKLFSPLEKYGLYVILTNCCVQMYDRGASKFSKECFDIYKIMFEKNLFDVCPGFFSMTTFTSVILTGLSTKEFEWIEKFIHEYSEKLNPGHKADAMNYGLAQLNFTKGNFSESLQLISKTNTEFSNFKFQLRMLQLKNYFELGDYDSLYYALDSFSHFLNKNKLVGSIYKNEFNNFIRILDLLVTYKLEKTDDLYYKIKKRLEDKAIASKLWLKSKFEDNQ